MIKKNLEKEMKFYEAIGIKHFRNAAFGLRNALYFPFTIFKSKEKRKEMYNYLNSIKTNYNFGTVRSLEDIKSFKKQLAINASIHTIGSVSCISSLAHQFSTSYPNTGAIITSGVCLAINIYCIILQRYNQIRINDLIKKMTPHYLRQKNKEREEVRKKDATLPIGHTFTLVDKKGNEEAITIDELIENANMEDLRRLKNGLEDLRTWVPLMEYKKENDDPITVSTYTIKNKKLNMTYKQKRC
jgi:hypothetical protein